jgi:hypothetical protein
MPLAHLYVSGPSRIMMPVYVAHATFFGMLYVIDPMGRLERTPGLTAARALLPMWAWGLMFLALAAVMLTARMSGRGALMVWGLYAYAATLIIWAGVYAAAPFITPDASIAGPAWALTVSAACFATARSVLNEGR